MVEDILHGKKLSVNNIDIKVLFGKVEDISREWEKELISALLDYFRGTKTFRINSYAHRAH